MNGALAFLAATSLAVVASYVYLTRSLSTISHLNSQVAHRGLKDRRERALSPEDVTHYTRTCNALAATVEHMSLVDEVIEAHGGFPLTGSQNAAPLRAIQRHTQKRRNKPPVEERTGLI